MTSSGHSGIDQHSSLYRNPDPLRGVTASDRSVAANSIGRVDLLVDTDSTIGRRLRELRVVSSQVHTPTRLVGRDSDLARIRAAFHSQDQIPNTLVVTGMGGVGKTSLARTYAATHQQRYSLVWWIHAQQPADIVDQFRSLLSILLPGETQATGDPIAHVHAVLANRSQRWLLVLDNVVNPAAAAGLIPAVDGGDVLITSQAANWPGYRVLPLGKLTVEHGATLLTSLSGDDDQAAAKRLAGELDGFPLALAQAGAYVASTYYATGHGLAHYLDLYRREQHRLLGHGTAPGYELPVATTWQVAFDRLAAPARTLLNLLARCAPEAIPLDLILDHLSPGGVPEQIADLVYALTDDELVRNQAVADLSQYSLITPNATGSVDVHRLVQAITKAASDGAPDSWAIAGLTLINNSYPASPATATHLDQAGRLRDHARKLLQSTEPDTVLALDTRQNLAYWRGEAGDAAGAAAAFADLLTDRLRVLGPDHPDTLTTRHELAYWRGEAGDAAGAAAAFGDLLTDRLRVLGPDHPDTLTTRHELAYWRGRTGDASGAATALADLLVDRLRILGPDHPHTLTTRHNLARWRGRTGDASDAAAAFGDLLTDRLRILGPDHPATLATRHELARWRGEAGNASDAATALADLLTDAQRVLGPDHPDTLATRHNLARWRGEAGDAAGAAAAFGDLLTDRLRVLGPDHPDTLATRHELAYWRGRTGDASGAATALADLLTDAQRVFGPDHPDTVSTRDELAYWRDEAAGTV
jgi:hypothetical protein